MIRKKETYEKARDIARDIDIQLALVQHFFRDKDIQTLINAEIMKIENTELTSKPLTMEVRTDD